MALVPYFPLLMFPALLIGILSGLPVAFVLALIGFFFGITGALFFDVFALTDFGFVAPKIFGVIGNTTLLAVPMFIVMGLTLERSQIAEDLLDAMEKTVLSRGGGLLYGIVLVGALLAASTGIVGATVVTMGVVALPSMLRRGYNPRVSAGTIAAAGTLGQIVPPSIVLILLGDVMNVPVADLFAGAVIPSLLLIILYLLYIFLVSTFFLEQRSETPELAPAPSGRASLATALFPPIMLILAVLGSILMGIATPTEAAGCGAGAAFAIATLRGRLDRERLWDILTRSLSLTSMVFTLLIGAQVFAVAFRGMSGDVVLVQLLNATALPPALLFWFLMLFLFVLGFFLDFLEICVIFVPIMTPILVGQLGLPPLYVAILIALNLQTSFLTPPFGFSLFYLRGVAPASISTRDIYWGVLPFVLLQIFTLIVVSSLPSLALWLPSKLW